MKAFVYRGPGQRAQEAILKAYETFGNAGREQALKVIVTNP